MPFNIENILTILLLFGYSASGTYAVECQNKDLTSGGNWTAYGTSCYLFVDNVNEHFNAGYLCRQNNAYSVVINNNEENAFIRNHLRNLKRGRWWIGLSYDNNSWVWYRTQERANYTDWAPGHPTNKDWRCAYFDMTSASNGHWNDASCDMHFSAICEHSFNDNNGMIVG